MKMHSCFLVLIMIIQCTSRKRFVRGCVIPSRLLVATADFWPSLTYESAVRKPKHCTTLEFLQALSLIIMDQSDLGHQRRALTTKRPPMIHVEEKPSSLHLARVCCHEYPSTWSKSGPLLILLNLAYL